MNGINAVISEEALKMHGEYLRELRLKYSVLEKSYPELSGKSLFDISKARVRGREEAILLKSEIMLHELYFSSFGEGCRPSGVVRRCYGSEANFLYEMFLCAKECKDGFAVIYLRNGKLLFTAGECDLLLKIANPILAVDLCEHAYFLDYGFDKNSYLRKLLPYLNISKADKILSDKD